MPDQVPAVVEACYRVRPAFGPIAMAIMLGSFLEGEVVNLRRADIDLDTRWARATDFVGDDQADAWSPKSETSHRAVPLHPMLAETLRAIEPTRCPDGTESPWMFPVSDPRKRKRLYVSAGVENRARLVQALVQRVEVNEANDEVTVVLTDLDAALDTSAAEAGSGDATEIEAMEATA